jgi:hypothetical protein
MSFRQSPGSLVVRHRFFASRANPTSRTSKLVLPGPFLELGLRRLQRQDFQNEISGGKRILFQQAKTAQIIEGFVCHLLKRAV